MLIDRACAQCGNIFQVEQSRLKYGRGKTCSRTCQYLFIQRRVDLTCAQCGQPFALKQSDVAYRTRLGEPPKYCSRKCAHASPEWSANLSISLRQSEALRRSRVHTVPVMTAKSRSAAGRAQRREQALKQQGDPEMRARWLEGIRLRSQSEVWRGAAHFQRGAAHPRYKGTRSGRAVAMRRYAYKIWRTAVYQRDNYTCQDCGARGVRLNAHHIQPWATHPELRYEITNGRTLCEPCHRVIPKP